MQELVEGNSKDVLPTLQNISGNLGLLLSVNIMISKKALCNLLPADRKPVTSHPIVVFSLGFLDSWHTVSQSSGQPDI